MITLEIGIVKQDTQCGKCDCRIKGDDNVVMKYNVGEKYLVVMCLKCGLEIVIGEKKKAFKQFEELEEKQHEIESLL